MATRAVPDAQREATAAEEPSLAMSDTVGTPAPRTVTETAPVVGELQRVAELRDSGDVPAPEGEKSEKSSLDEAVRISVCPRPPAIAEMRAPGPAEKMSVGVPGLRCRCQKQDRVSGE